MESLKIIIPVVSALFGSIFTFILTSRKLSIKSDSEVSKNYADLIQSHEKRIEYLENENKELLKDREQLIKIKSILDILSRKKEFEFIKNYI